MDGYPLSSAVAAPGELLFLPLGGAGEIGMNLNLFGYNGQWVMVDLGVTFGEDGLPGIDVVMPDPAFIAERRKDLLGLVLTHAHEDHIGAVQYLWPRLRCPIWCTPFTASVLRRKLAETSFAHEVPITVVPLTGAFDIGPFQFEMITLTHSIPEPNALAIRTPVGTVLHTGDWKFDPNPLIGAVSDTRRLRELGDEGVLALVGDSTNVFKDGVAGSEADVRASLTRLFGDYPDGRIAVACFASNVARLESVAMAAAAHDRRVALVGRSLRKMDEAARENGYLADLPPFLTEEEAGYMPADKVVLLCTGSQGEPRAALARIAADDHPHVVLEEGDVVIFSSRVIPGNERAIGRMQDRLIRNGVRVVTEGDHFVHVSGHPARDELAEMYALTRPRIAIPVHGELRHMHEHAALARACQVPEALVAENGQVIKLAPGAPRLIDTVPSGRLALEGTRLTPLFNATQKQRSKLNTSGIAVATLVVDRHGRLKADPVLSLLGLLDPNDPADAGRIEGVMEAVKDAVEGFARPSDDGGMKEAARLALRRAIQLATGLKPMTEIHLVRV